MSLPSQLFLICCNIMQCCCSTLNPSNDSQISPDFYLSYWQSLWGHLTVMAKPLLFITTQHAICFLLKDFILSSSLTSAFLFYRQTTDKNFNFSPLDFFFCSQCPTLTFISRKHTTVHFHLHFQLGVFFNVHPQ